MAELNEILQVRLGDRAVYRVHAWALVLDQTDGLASY